MIKSLARFLEPVRRHRQAALESAKKMAASYRINSARIRPELIRLREATAGGGFLLVKFMAVLGFYCSVLWPRALLHPQTPSLRFSRTWRALQTTCRKHNGLYECVCVCIYLCVCSFSCGRFDINLAAVK